MWFQNFYDTFYKCFIKEDRYQLLLDGIGVTVKVSLLAVVFGLLIGFLIALCNLSNKKGIRLIGKVYTDIIRGTPTVTQLMIIYFVIFASVHWPKWVIAAIAFGINSGAYVSEIIRAGILSVDKGQTEAGRSLGLNGIVGYVGLVDIQKAGDFIKTSTYEAFMPLIGTAIIYFVIIKLLTLALGRLEKRLRKSEVR